jgi:hypothetical protein
MAWQFGAIKDVAEIGDNENSATDPDLTMSFDRLRTMPFSSLLIATALAVGAAGCAGGATKVVAEAAGMATTPQEAKPFVQETRPAAVAYIPVGSSVTRQAPRQRVDDFKKMEAELEARRLAIEAAGNQARTLGSATEAPAPAKLPTN